MPASFERLTAALAVALGFLVASRRDQWPVWVLGGLFLLGVGWNRVYLGGHYPPRRAGRLGRLGGLHLLFSSCRSELRTWGRQVAHVWRFLSHP